MQLQDWEFYGDELLGGISEGVELESMDATLPPDVTFWGVLKRSSHAGSFN